MIDPHDDKNDNRQTTPKRNRLTTFSIKSMLILTTLVAFGIFLLGPTTITIHIPHDEGAWIGGVPKIGNEIDVYGGTGSDSPWVVKGAIVANRPDWKFRDGTAMHLDVMMKRYQAWPMGGFKYCRIVKKEAEQMYSF